MNNAHPAFEGILAALAPNNRNLQVFKRTKQMMDEVPSLSRERATRLAEKQVNKYPIMFNLIDKWDNLCADRCLEGPTSDITMNMARIKTILRERYNYTVTY